MAALRTQLTDNGPSAGLTAPAMSAVSSSSTRSVSHGRRSQSLSEGHHSPATPAASTGNGVFPAAPVDSRSGDGAQPIGQEGVAAGSGSGSGLARRNNTVSTASSSRLVRLERNRARLALQGVGLSEEDQEFYVPPSPVNGGPYAVWSDVGHGDSSIPTKTAAAAAAVNAQAAWSSIQEEDNPLPDQPPRNSSQAGSSSQAQSFANPEPKRSSFVVVRGGKGDAALTERRARERGVSAPGTESTLYPSPIGSSLSTSPRQQALVSSPGRTPEDQPLRHKNSLKPFLEQELAQQGGDEVQEDWEKGLLAERRSGAGGGGLEAGGVQQNLRTPPLSGGALASQLSSPYRTNDSTSPRFGQPQRGQTIDPWLQPPTATPSPAVSSFSEAGDEPLRRHQSLKAFRTPRYREASIEQTLSTSPGSSPWPESGGGPADEFFGGQHARQSSHLSVASANSAGSFASRTRSGTGPAPLALQHSNSLGHSSSSGFAESLGPVRLSHSNSLSAAYPSSSGSGSTTLHHSNSLGSRSDSGMSTGGGEGRSRVLSPVVSSFGGAKSPWSLTEEESQQLGLNNAPYGSNEAIGVSRDSSGSSRSARADRTQKVETLAQAAPEGINQAAYAAEVRRLEEALATMQMGGLVAPTSFSQFDRHTPSPGAGSAARRLAPLMTSTEALNVHGTAGRHGPASAAAFVPPIGHSHTHFAPHTLDGISEYSSTASSSPPMPQQQHFQSQAAFVPTLPAGGVNGLAPAFDPSPGRNNLTAVPDSVHAADWARQKEYLMGGGPAVANHNGGGPIAPQGPPLPPTADPQVATLQQIQMQQQQQQIASLQSQMAQALSAMDAMRAQGAVLPANFDLANATRLSNAVNAVAQQQQQQGVPETPVDVPALAQTKGYNPTMFDLNPPNARFFVIKSYTEEDVHKSLKYEIWASTDLGNKRLDRAFRESADKGPIYLFFSVNASGHFAGVAQMQTPVDYSMSSNVWASDKWKGVLKVRWIYIKDVPLAALRHIRLSNTPENKPVTSSRDTQEVPYEAGLEVLRIIANYQSRTSLLQDYAWYEAQFRRNQQFAPAGAGVDAQVQPGDPALPQPAPHYANANANANSSSPGPPGDGQQRAPRQQQQQHQQQQQSSSGGRRFWNRAPPQNGPNRSSPGPPPHAHHHGQFAPYPQQLPPGPPLPPTMSPPSQFYPAFPQQEHPNMPPGHY